METIRYSLIGAEDINFGDGKFEVTLADGRVVSLSKVDTVRASGSVEISDAATSAAVTLPVTLASTNYRVSFGHRPGSGTPPGVIIRYTNPTVTGFTIEISGSPGTGNSIIVDWHVAGGWV